MIAINWMLIVILLVVGVIVGIIGGALTMIIKMMWAERKAKKDYQDKKFIEVKEKRNA